MDIVLIAMSINKFMNRKSKIERNTQETKIFLELELDSTKQSNIECNIPFLEHLLSHIAKHGHLYLNLKAKGDIEIDYHHTVEDIGIVLGKAILESIGDKKGINRYGYASVPMDETLANVSLDLSGRSALVFNASFNSGKIGDFDAELIKEFMRALCQHAQMTLHINVLYGENNHHIAEAIFKSFGLALKMAVSLTGTNEIPSTKGVL